MTDGRETTGPGGVVREVFGGAARVVARARLSGGASRETWSVDVADAAGRRHALVLRLASGPGPEGGLGGELEGGLRGEAELMRQAGRAGVPVPGVVAATDAYLVMTRVEGETIPRRILRDDLYRDARSRLAAQCGQALAAIHRMPVPGGEAADPLRRWRDLLDLTGQPHPVFELAFRRLAGTRPAPAGRVLVHGDFRNGNLVVGPEGLRAVLDWELAHAGDPLEDLGWLCVRAWRFGAAPPVGGFGHYDELIGAYERAGGRPVDRDALRWWETFGVLKWGVICVMQAMRHLRGGERSVELAAIGRRVCENEWDLLRMLD
ncbi:phosphotransferase family protein [Nonomuraea sp. ATR24]|uniref:phosphotransferase family protein n=1 Tax=Nonomuraea sp. ATR24 TaxID=1676744 RepID=UPI0035C1956E